MGAQSSSAKIHLNANERIAGPHPAKEKEEEEARDTWEWLFISNASTGNGEEMGQDDDGHRKSKMTVHGRGRAAVAAAAAEAVKCANPYPVFGLFVGSWVSLRCRSCIYVLVVVESWISTRPENGY